MPELDELDLPALEITPLNIERERVRAVSASVAVGAPVRTDAPLIARFRPTPFQRTYRNNPEAFIMDCFNWNGSKPADYQLEIAANLPIKKRVAVRGPHTLGKTGVAAWLTNWFALTRDGEDWKLPTTAGAWRQLSKYLWPEIHKWARRIRWDVTGREPYSQDELMLLNLKLKSGEAFAVASNNHDLIEGAHADSIFMIFDESKAIPEATFDALEGAFSGGEVNGTEAFALAISTPGEPIGRFYQIHRRQLGYEDWWVRHVTKEEAIAAGRMSAAWAEQRRLQWTEQSALYQNRVCGEFYSSDEEGVIPLAWVEAAIERWHEQTERGTLHHIPFTCLGVDVARSGDNKTVVARRFENVISQLSEYPKQDTMATAGVVSGILRARGGYAVVDLTGVGAGVHDKLREDKMESLGFIAGGRCDAKDHSKELGFVNLRSAAWWHMRELLDPALGQNIALPPDDELTGDLVAPRWQIKSGGKIAVESKGETADGGKGVIQRLGRSTDKGDAVVQAFCPKKWIAVPKSIWVAV